MRATLLLVPLVAVHATNVGQPLSGCMTQRDGYDMEGHDLGDGIHRAMSAGECCDLCSQAAGCAAAVWANTAATKGCFFKDSAVAGLKPAPGFTFLEPRIEHSIPPPSATCIDWVECIGGTAGGQNEGNCPPVFAHAGHQCESFPQTGPQNCYRGGPDENATQEALCVPILANGTTDFRVGHDNIISLKDDPNNEGGCIYNDQTGMRRRDFREFRAVQKPAPAPELKWVLTRSGYRVPPGALHTGLDIVAGRTLVSATNKGSVLPGWIKVTGGVMGPINYDDQPSPDNNKPVLGSVDYDSADYELACCGTDADCTPVPNAPSKFTHPWIRFAHAIPTDHQVDCEVTLGGANHSWNGYAYGVFSDWSGQFDALSGNGTISIYESVGGKRGKLLATEEKFLPPGPVLIALKGDTWPPVPDTPSTQGSIEVIANSFSPPGDEPSVCLFNLSPDTPRASMTREAKEIATGIAFGDRSTWSGMPATSSAFTVTDAATVTNVLTSFTKTPPLGASSVYLIGKQDKTAPKEYQTNHVWLIDSPPA